MEQTRLRREVIVLGMSMWVELGVIHMAAHDTKVLFAFPLTEKEEIILWPELSVPPYY